MSKREWPITTIQRADHGARQRATEIRCGACGEKDHVINTSNNKVLPSTMVEKKFQQAGWAVGAGPAADRCPACVAKLRGPKPALKIVPKPTPVAEEVVQMQEAAAAPPPPMTREDRRVIFEKLNEVYVDEKTGYDRGWSDKRIAEDLGTKRAWVQQVRDEMFGPARDNEDVRDFVSMLTPLTNDVAALTKDAADIVARVKVIEGRAAELAKVAAAILKAVA